MRTRLNAKTNKLYPKIAKKIINLLGTTIDVDALASNYDQYAHALKNCKITDISCSKPLHIEVNYIALIAAAFNVTLQTIAQLTPQQYKAKSKQIIHLWDNLIDVLDMHYFYLGFALFMHSIATPASKRLNSIITPSGFFWGVEAVPSLVLAILSNNSLRNSLRHLMVPSYVQRGYFTKTVDAFFNLLRGFAVMRNLIIGIEFVINQYYPHLNMTTSKTGMSVRYGISGLYSVFQASEAWRQPPSTKSNVINSTHSPATIFQNSLTATCFLFLNIFNVVGINSPHQQIVTTGFLLIFIGIIVTGFYSALTAMKRQSANINEVSHANESDRQQNDIIHAQPNRLIPN